MKRIFLIGYMGAGKTTVGRLLARRMGLSFIDLDCYIENRYQKSVSRLFAERGENGFREIERALLREVGEFENVLVATGGGAPCFYDNMDFMNGCGTTVYLKVPVAELAVRLEKAKQSRPLVKDKSREELCGFIAGALEKREPFYGRAACIFDAGKMNDEADVWKITDELEKLL